MANLIQSIVNFISSGGFSSGSAKSTTNSGGSKSSSGSVPSASKGSAKATSTAYKTNTSTGGTTKKSGSNAGTGSTGGGTGSSSNGRTANSATRQNYLADYAVKTATERAKTIVDDDSSKKDKLKGYSQLEWEADEAKKKAQKAEVDYGAALEKYGYDASAPQVKAAKSYLDDALRDAKIFSAAADKEKQMPHRVSDTVKGAAKQYGAGLINTAGTLYEGGTRGAEAQYEREREELRQRLDNAQKVYDETAAKYNGDTENPNVKAAQATVDDIKRDIGVYTGVLENDSLQETTKRIYDKADAINASAAEDISRAKDGLGKIGQFAVDAGVAGAQLLGDAALGAVTGGGAMLPLVARSFGAGASEARNNGASYEKQVLYGAASTATEVAFEKVTNGLAGIYGKGAADELVEKAIGKLANTDAGRTVLRALAGMGGEAAEEFATSAIAPLLQTIYNGQSIGESYSDEQITDWLYDALIGGVLGGAGSIASIASGQDARANAALRAAQEAQEAPAVAGGEITPVTEQTTQNEPQSEFNTQEQQAPIEQVATSDVSAPAQSVIEPTQAQTTAETTMGAGPIRERGGSANIRTNQNVEQELRGSFEEAPEMYTQLTNAEVQKKADAIMSEGFERARTKVEQALGAAKTGYKLAPEYAVAAQSVANELTRRGDLDGARHIMSDVIAEFTAAGQFAQIGRMIRRADPVTKTLSIQKLVERLNENLTKGQLRKNRNLGRGDDSGKIIVSDELLERYANAPDDATRDAVMEEIEQTIADQIPATFREKFTAMRYLNMLGNFKTQGRNITGNTISLVSTVAKRKVQAVAELATAAATGGKYERNTSLVTSPELRKLAKEDFELVKEDVKGDTKYTDVARQANKGIEEKRTVFGSGKNSETLTRLVSQAASKATGKEIHIDVKRNIYENGRRLTNWAMEAGDEVFLKFHYADALAGYLQAHGVTAEKWNEMVAEADNKPTKSMELERPIANGTVVKALDRGNYGYVQSYNPSTNTYAVRFVSHSGAEATVNLAADKVQSTKAATIKEAQKAARQNLSFVEKAREFAKREAQEATFRDDNAVSRFVENIDKNWDNGEHGKLGSAAKVATQGIMPFRKTPANVAVRAVEYSPLGVGKAIIDGIMTTQGKANAADVINDISKAATGSVLAIAGYMLAARGIARGSEDDDELAAFQSTQGQMDYSIKIGDTYVSLAQFAPNAVPFFMGVKLQELLDESDGIFSTDDITAILSCISDPMLEMSMLSGINDAFNNLSSFSGDSDASIQFAANAMLSFLTQGITNTLVGQFEQAFEENRQTIYTANETNFDKFLGKWQYKAGQTAAKIPGVDYHQQDYVDAWGRTQSNGDTVTRILNSFINPTYFGSDRSTAVDSELERLYRDNKDTEDFPNVFPQKRSRSDVYGDGKLMTADEYLQYSKDSGQMKLELVSDFMESEQYGLLEDSQRAEVISQLYQFADDRALKKVKEANNVDAASNWDDEAMLVDLPAYLSAKTAYVDAADPNNKAPNFNAVDALLATLPAIDRATRDKMDDETGFKNLRFASEVYGMDAEQAIGIRNLVEGEQDKHLKGASSGAADAAVIAKEYKGTDAEKIAALETQNLPYADAGTRRSIVRRFEAAQTEGISFDEWSKIESYVDRTKTSDTPNKATIVAAGEALGYSGSLIYQIYKKYPLDEDIVQQKNDYFHKDYVEPEDVDLFAYLTGLALGKTEETETKKSSGGYRSYGGRSWGGSGSNKVVNLGDSVSAVRSIANKGTSSNTNLKYLKQAVSDVISSNKKQQSQAPNVTWQELLAGYVKGL